MHAMIRPIGLAAAMTAFTLAPAWAEGLAVTPGLWEMTSTGNNAAPPMPQIPADALAKMSPQQQAMVQQRMAMIAAAAGQPMTSKLCVTQAMLDKGYAGPENGRHCTRTPVTRSSSVLEFKLMCPGDHPTTGTVHIEATDAQTIAGTVDMNIVTKEGASFPMHRTMQGHWLAADCGSVKPPQ